MLLAAQDPSPLGSLQLVSLVFSGVLILFLMAAFFLREHIGPQHQQILRFLASLCGGFAGGFFTGDLAVKSTVAFANGNPLAVGATGGAAVFFLVFFFYGKAGLLAAPDPRVNFAVPDNWSFSETARALAQGRAATVELLGFTPEELSAKVTPGQLNASSLTAAFERLRDLVPPGSVRAFVVTNAASRYTLATRA